MSNPAARPFRPGLTALLVAALGFVLGTGCGLAQDIRVEGPDALQKALANTKGGVILLAPGEYGDLSLSGRQFPAPVILKAEVPRKAVFGKILLADSGNLEFVDLRTRAQFRADRSTDLHLSGCQSENMLYFRSVARLKVDNCKVTGGRYGILFNTVSDFDLRRTRVGGVTEDVMRITGDSHDGLIENNIIADTIARKPTHPDLIQTFSADGKTPHDITIRANLLYDDPATGEPDTAAQGIFMAGGGTTGYRNILLEQNLIHTRAANSIFMGGGQDNVVIRNNTLLPSTGDGGAIIRLSKFKGFDNSGTRVEGNVAKVILDESGRSKIGRNYLYGRNAPLSRMFQGQGTQWQDFQPAPGSAIERAGLGAAELLAGLQAAARNGIATGLGPDWTE